jgi:hypothetical protein
MPTLADIYSAIDSAKRKGSDFVQNPGASLQQMVGLANDRAGEINQQTAAAAQEGMKYGPASQALGQTLAGAYNPIGMTVWHGSPYKFNQFDASKIGKGEGHQVYGHGLYVAENPEVAKGYAANVKDIDSIQSYNQRLKQILKVMDEDSVYPGAYRKFKSEKGREAAEEYDHVMAMRDQKAADKGNLYKVDLPDEHIDKMMDWDKPISKQHPNVQKAISKIADKFPSIPDFDLQKYINADPLASTLHNVINRDLGVSQSKIAEHLSKLGIPGIKYLDQGSRDAVEGTRNFVVFPGKENLLSIQDINGNPIK